jgi:hypothetical protein
MNSMETTVKRLATAAIMAIGGVILGAQSATLTDQQVADAIAHQREATNGIVWEGHAVSGAFRVGVIGPMTSIGITAAAATKQFKPFTVADVAADARQLRWTLSVVPAKPGSVGGNWTVSAPVNEVLLQRHGVTDIADVIRPISTTFTPETWSNAMGAKFEGRGAIAVFDATTLPAGDLDIVIVTSANPRRYELPAKDRAKVR